jgi:hypothetical protein
MKRRVNPAAAGTTLMPKSAMTTPHGNVEDRTATVSFAMTGLAQSSRIKFRIANGPPGILIA